MSIAQNFPEIRPSLNLDFANVKALDSRVTFARASTGAYYDGQTVAKAEENLVLYSQEFDNAYWNKPASIAITANSTTSPDGTTTAELFDEGTGNQTKELSAIPTFLASTTYTLSCFFEDVDRQYVSLAAAGLSNIAVAVEFDLTAGTVNRTAVRGWTVNSSSITDVGSGWYRAVVIFTTDLNITVPRVVIQPSDGTSTLNVNGDYGRVSYTGTNKQFYLWGAQLEQRSSATAYTPTTTQSITLYQPALQTAASGVARFDHDPVTQESLGLLIEEQRTNLFTYSEEFDDAAWTKLGATITANTVVAPDGTLTMDKLVPATGSASSIYRANAIVGAKTLSCYMKTGGKTVGTLGWSGNSNGAYFDLSSGLATTFGSGTTASMVSVGNGVYLCSISFTYASGNQNHFIGVSDSVGFHAVTGDGYSGIYIWGAQLEAGAFPTSYIPTVASQVTRSADSASMTGANFSEWYRADEGTVYTDSITYGGNGPIAYLTDNTLNNLHQINANFGGSYQFTAYVVTNGVNVVNFNSTPLTYGTNFKIGYGFKTNDFGASVNGASVSTDTSGTLPIVNRLDIGRRFDGSYVASAVIKKIAYYPARLTNTQLQALTS